MVSHVLYVCAMLDTGNPISHGTCGYVASIKALLVEEEMSRTKMLILWTNGIRKLPVIISNPCP